MSQVLGSQSTLILIYFLGISQTLIPLILGADFAQGHPPKH